MPTSVQPARPLREEQPPAHREATWNSARTPRSFRLHFRCLSQQAFGFSLGIVLPTVFDQRHASVLATSPERGSTGAALVGSAQRLVEASIRPQRSGIAGWQIGGRHRIAIERPFHQTDRSLRVARLEFCLARDVEAVWIVRADVETPPCRSHGRRIVGCERLRLRQRDPAERQFRVDRDRPTQLSEHLGQAIAAPCDGETQTDVHGVRDGEVPTQAGAWSMSIASALSYELRAWRKSRSSSASVKKVVRRASG